MKLRLSFLLLTSALLAACDSSASVDAHNERSARLTQLIADARYDEVVGELTADSQAQPLSAGDWLQLSRARLGQDEVPKAERALRDGLEAYPGDLELSLLLSRVYQSLGQVKRSLAVLEAVPEQQAQSAEFFMELGVAQGRQNDLKAARATFDKAREAGAEAADVEFNLGVIMAATHNHTQAIAHFERALEEAPERAYVRRELASAMLSEQPADADRARIVSGMVDQVLELDPEDWRAWSLLADTQMVLQDPVAAKLYYTNALKFSQNDPSVESKYVIAARAVQKLLEEEGLIDPSRAPRKGAPPIPISVQERMKAAQREAQQGSGEALEGDSGGH